MIQQPLHLLRGDLASGRLHIRSGDTGGRHEVEVQGQPLRDPEHKSNTGFTKDIGNLVRIGNNRRGPVRQRRRGKMRRQKQSALYMNMRINQPRDDQPPLEIDHLITLGIFSPHPGNCRSPEGHGALLYFPGKNIDNAASFKQERGRPRAAGHFTHLFQLFGKQNQHPPSKNISPTTLPGVRIIHTLPYPADFPQFFDSPAERCPRQEFLPPLANIAVIVSNHYNRGGETSCQ